MSLEDQLEGLGKEEIALVLTSSQEYAGTMLSILRHLVGNKERHGIYVTVNKPYSTLMELLEKEEIPSDNLFFIDAISEDTGADELDADNVLFLDSPQNLTDISIAVSKAADQMEEDKFIFMDSLSTLSIYNNTNTVSQFAHFLIRKMRKWKAKGVVIALEKEADEELISNLSQFCDSVIEA